MMIDVQVKLFGTFRRLLPAGAQRGVWSMQVRPGTRVDQVLAQLGVPLDSPDHLVILVNGRHRELDTLLQPGDILSAFPALEGG